MAGRAESEVKMPTIQATSIWKKNYLKMLSREWIQTEKYDEYLEEIKERSAKIVRFYFLG